jgi:cytochrome c biogenesis protein CcmG/thiol:disulfide interchange protein DsbE
MKNKINIFILFIILSFCFITFYKGLDDSNTYIPEISDKKNIPIFKAKDFNSGADVN